MNKETKIGIFGAGVEGLEAARYFIHHCYKNVFLFDAKEKIDAGIPDEVKFYGGKDYLEKAKDCEIVFRSPGISLSKFQIQNSKFQLTSTTQYFMEHCPCPIIGVTGTKGKGTTSTLITLMLKEAGHDVHLGGNIGQSPLSFLDQLKKDSVVVLEMSSFQLQDLTISPSIAVVLRVTSDHLDYHKDRDEYWEAKSSIVRFQKPDDIAIFNLDYDYSKYYLNLTKAKKILVSAKEKIPEGAFLEDGKIYFAKELIAEISKIALIGKHHLENVLPAVCVARLYKAPIPTIQKVLYTFAGLPHRLEFVREIHGVKYYNDSFSTTPETSIAATYAFEKPVILIAGGSEKGADYTEWGQELGKNPFLRAVFLIGQMAERMERSITNYELRITNEVITRRALEQSNVMKRENSIKVFRCQTLEEAVKGASELAQIGDIVVMSPAAASFDMFKNYKERGEKFREIVNKIKA